MGSWLARSANSSSPSWWRPRSTQASGPSSGLPSGRTAALGPEDARATNARLTPRGWRKIRDTAPGHVANVRQHVIDALTPEQVDQLTTITEAILHGLDPEGTMTAMYHRQDRTA
jgi:hypothetical protein